LQHWKASRESHNVLFITASTVITAALHQRKKNRFRRSIVPVQHAGIGLGTRARARWGFLANCQKRLLATDENPTVDQPKKRNTAVLSITMMNRGTIAIASRLAKNASKTSTVWKSNSMRVFLDQPHQYRTFLSSTPTVHSTTTATAVPEAAVPAVAAKKKRASKKKTDEDKEGKANKNTIISDIAETHSISLAEAGRIMDTVTGSIVDVRRVCVCVCV
jgi:hypothetical protein